MLAKLKRSNKTLKYYKRLRYFKGQKIGELARYADLTAKRVRLHDSQIYELQYRLLIVEDGIKEMIDVSNFQIYTSLSGKCSPDITFPFADGGNWH